MKIGRKARPESPEEMRLVHHALENSIRRKILILINRGCVSVEEISKNVRREMIDYHLRYLEFAGLIEIGRGVVSLTESGKAYGMLVLSQEERGSAKDP